MATDATLSERASPKSDVRDDLPTQERRGSGPKRMQTYNTSADKRTDEVTIRISYDDEQTCAAAVVASLPVWQAAEIVEVKK